MIKGATMASTEVASAIESSIVLSTGLTVPAVVAVTTFVWVCQI